MKKIIALTGILVSYVTTVYASPHQLQLFLRPSEHKLVSRYHLTPLKFMPGLYVGDLSKRQYGRLFKILQQRVSPVAPSYEELDVSAASMLLTTPDNASKPVSNWWDAGYTGKQAVIGILDSGVPDHYVDSRGITFTRQKGLENIHLIVNRGRHSGFNHYLNGIRTPHGTGVAGVFAEQDPVYKGIAHGARNMLVALAGDNTVDNTNWKLTLMSLDWLLTTRNQLKPTVINYSYGNGDIYCLKLSATCYNKIDWSPVARVVDYVVNHYQISWVKSAGNRGWIPATTRAPYASTMSIPADSYNAIVVANMDNTVVKTQSTLQKTSDRNQHTIHSTSSRGPTLNGRRKPDLTAPGTNIRACAPTNSVYAVAENPTFKPYAASMQYDPQTETRLITGTSIATPHVGAATALVYDAGIRSPMAIKALLINSADAWTDNDQPGPGDATACTSPLPNCGHSKMMGSQWNRTYGWGYINMDNAYTQRNFIHIDTIKPQQTLCYTGYLNQGDKVTLVWERRVGLTRLHHFWELTPLHLVMYDSVGIRPLAEDNSRIDNVLQVANYPSESQSVKVKVNIPYDVNHIDGAPQETFALASSSPLLRAPC